MLRLMLAITLGLWAGASLAQETTPEAGPETTPEATPPAPEAPAEPPMTFKRLEAILTAIDENAERRNFSFRLKIEEVPILVVTDPLANRMRAMVPVRPASELSGEDLLRVMQANFDTALDARYAVAQGMLWAVYIHPLKELERKQLISGLVQTINIARTYGVTFSGGAAIFGQGDSSGIYQELLDKLQDKGEEL